MSILSRSAWLSVIWSLLALVARSADDPAKPGDPALQRVAARVNQREVRVAEVQALMKSTPITNAIAPGAAPMLEAQALEQLISRAAVYEQLEKAGYHVSDQELDELLKKLEQGTPGQGEAFDQLLAKRGLNRPLLRRQLAWETLWKKYANDRSTDKKLQEYFDEHRADFDGTEVRVSHILLRPHGAHDPASLQASLQQAAQLRSQIEKGEISFAEAAKRFSSGPSRTQGGDLGFIPRHDRMVEPFSQAAFALKPGQISPPVVTPFGVHLIQAQEIKPGARKWETMRDELRKALSQELFKQAADEARKSATIEYAKDVPHLDPKTRQLVTP